MPPVLLAPDESLLWCAPGLGSQRLVAPLWNKFSPAFRDALEEGMALAHGLGVEVRPVLLGDSELQLARTRHALPAIILLNHALMELIRREGAVVPMPQDLLLGISFGELSMLAASGMLSLADALLLGHAVGEALEQQTPFDPQAGWPMAVVLGLPEESVRGVGRQLRKHGKIMEVGNYLCPDRVAISGEPAALAEATVLLKQQGPCEVLQLRVTAPFHTTLCRGVMEKVNALPATAAVTVHPARVTVLSNLTGEPLPATREAVLQSLSNQLTGKVMLTGALKRTWSRGVRRVVCLDPSGRGVQSLMDGNRRPGSPWQVLDVRNPDHQALVRSRLRPA